jgi:hypothetical protein
MTDLPIRADLLIHGAALVATVDDDRRELAGGWVAITDGLISGVGDSTDPMTPAAALSPQAWSTPTITCSRTSPAPTRR